MFEILGRFSQLASVTKKFAVISMTALKKRTAEARRAQSFRGYQRKIFAFSARPAGVPLRWKLAFFSGLIHYSMRSLAQTAVWRIKKRNLQLQNG